jgi:putative transposase
MLSDQCSQYTSEAFKEALAQHGLIQSLSGVDHCYENARMESFFATLKKELLYRLPTYQMKREGVKRWIFRYVFTYYNRERVHTSNPGGLPPAVYRAIQEEQKLAAFVCLTDCTFLDNSNGFNYNKLTRMPNGR